MTVALRPMNLGGVLDRAVQILGARFLLFAGIAVLPGLANLAWQMASAHRAPSTDTSTAYALMEVARQGVALVFWIVNLVLQAIATAAACLAASKVHLGEPITIRAALSPFKTKGGRLVWLEFLQGVYAGWPLFIVIFASVALLSLGISIYLQAAMWIVGSIPCIVLYAGCALAFPATAIENLPAYPAISRSIKLSEGGRWRICGGFVFPLVVAAGYTYGSAWTIERLRLWSPVLAGSPLAFGGLDGVLKLIGDLIFLPLSATVLTVLYYDQRIRREGYDVERMMEEAGMVAPLAVGDGAMTRAGGEERKG